MVHAYWLIGRHLVEVEQQGKNRAGYGDLLLKRLSEHLTDKYGKGFGRSNANYMRRFYLAFSKGSA